MNETALLINSPFSLTQKNNVPVYTQVGDKIIRPYNDDEIKDSLRKQMSRDKKAGLDKETIFKKCKYLELFLRRNTKKEEERIEYPIDLQKLKRIIITPKAKGYITTAFIEFTKAHNIPIYWINGEGMIDACFMPSYFKKPSLILKQYEAKSNDSDIEIAKYIIGLKFKSQNMDTFIKNLDKAKTISDIIQIEGGAAYKYYLSWTFDNKWQWKGRRGKNPARNLHAIDPINAMLNLGYSLLAQQMSEILLKRGFELSIGFFHAGEKRQYWNILTYDFIEPYRVLIDNTVLGIVNNSLLAPDDFTFTKDKSHMILKDKPFEMVVDTFRQVLNQLEYKSLPMIREIEKML